MPTEDELYEKGYQVMKEHLGDQFEPWMSKLKKAKLFTKVNIEFPFGMLYGDPNSVLDQKTKELATIAALTVQSLSDDALRVHIGAALNVGACADSILEIITQMTAYVGFPATTKAIIIAIEELEKRELI